MNEGLLYILREMFLAVKLNLSDNEIKEYIKKEYWFLTKEWSIDEENIFIDYISDNIYKNNILRKSLQLPKNKSIIKKEIKKLMFDIGWKIKNE